MENKLDPSIGQASNFVYGCPEPFPADIAVEWEFWPIREPGRCMLFFAAAGRNGEELFDEHLPERSGEYQQYHSGAINTLHVSYFRRRYPEERAFHTCNLRKSYGAHLVCQGADPIPDVEDDGVNYGSHLGEGKIGFRQMAPLVGEYANFNVYELSRE